MSGIWQRAASGPAWSVPGNRAPTLRGTTASSYGKLAANAGWTNAAGRATHTSLNSSPLAPAYKAPTIPEKVNITLPYSSRPELTAPVSAKIKQESVGDWFASFGDEIGQLMSGGDINIGNIVPFLMERGPVLASKAAEALATPFLGPATAKQVTTDALNVAMAPIIGVSEFLAPIMNAPRDMFLDSQLDNRAQYVRWLADPRPLEQSIGDYAGKDWLGNPRGFGESPQSSAVAILASLRYYRASHPGASDAQIRQLMAGSVDLPDSVKAAAIAQPAVRGSTLAGATPEGRMFSYKPGFEGVAGNLIAEGSILALEIMTGKALLAPIRVAASAFSGSRAVGAVPGLARTLSAAPKAVSIASKVSRASIMAGTGALGLTSMMQTVARYQGDQAAYDTWQRINETTPLSSNPDVAFVTSFAATGLEGLAFLKRGIVPIGRGVTAPIGKLAGQAGLRILSADGLVNDRLARMFADGKAEGTRVIDTYLPTMGVRRSVLMTAAADIVISRLDTIEKASLSAIMDGAQRTEALMRRHAPELFAVIKDEPATLIEHWRGDAWSRHFGDFGLPFHADAMGLITRDFQEAQALSYEIRQRLQGVVGMVEYVTPERIQGLRVDLRGRYASAGDLVDPSDLYALAVSLPGLRHDFRGYRLQQEKLGRVVDFDQMTRGEIEAIFDGSELRYADAAKLDPELLRTGRSTPLSPEAKLEDIAVAVGSDRTTIAYIRSAKPEELIGDALERVKLFVEQKRVLSEDVLRGMTPEAIQRSAQKQLDGMLAPMHKAWTEQQGIRQHIFKAREKLERAVASKDEVAVRAARDELERLTTLQTLAYDPVNPFSTTAVDAIKEQKLSDAMRDYDRTVENRQRARDAIADLDALTDQLHGLTDMGSGIEGQLRYSPRTGWQVSSPNAPRFGRKSEVNIAVYFNGRGMAREGSIILDGSDEAIAYKLKAWATGGHGWKADKGSAAALRKMVGPAAAQKILRGTWRAEPEATLLDSYLAQRGIDAASGTGVLYDEMMDQIRRIMDDRLEILDSVGDIGNEAAIRRSAAAMKAPTLPPRVKEAFRRRLEGEPTHNVAEAKKLAGELGSMTDDQVSAAMKRWGFRWGRDDELGTVIDGSFWRYGIHDPLWETTEHPLNLKRLSDTIDGWRDYDGGSYDDMQEAAIEAIFDGDRILARRATDILKKRAFEAGLPDLRRVPSYDEVGSLTQRGGLPDWTALSKGDLEVVLAERKQALTQGPLRGELDDAIRIGSNDQIEAAWKRKVAEPPVPEAPFEETVAATEAMASTPLPARKSSAYIRDIRTFGGDIRQRANVAVIEKASNKTGIDVISVIEHGVIGVKPATLRGPLDALREIENGNASKLGIGTELLAEGQRVAYELLDAGVRDAKAAGFDLGVLSHGWAPHLLEEEEWALARELAGREIVSWDARGNLQYGYKKRPMNVMETPAEVKARLEADADGERAALMARLRPGGELINRSGAYEPGREAEARAVNLAIEALSNPRLVRAGSVPTEFAAAEVAANVRNVPSLAEELLTDGFAPYAARLDEAAARQAFNAVFHPAPEVRSAFGRDPWRYIAGALPNEQIGAFVKRTFTQRVVEQGFSASIADAIWQRWEEVARSSAEVTALGQKGLEKRRYERPLRLVKGDHPRYAAVRNIPTADMTAHAIEAISDFLARTGEGVPHDISRVNFGLLFRESASPVMRHLTDGLDIAGRRVQVPLGDLLSSLYGKVTTNKAVTTLYPIFRFAMDVRFWAMNYLEPNFLYMGRAGLRGAPRYGTAGLGQMTKDYLAYLNRGVSMFGEGVPRTAGRRMDQAYAVFLKERSGAVEGAFRSNEDLMEQALREIAKTDADLRDTILAFESGDKVRIGQLDAESAKRARQLLDGGVETWLKELDAWHGKLLKAADVSSAIDEEIAGIIAANPAMDALAARIGEANKAVWEDVHQLFWGKTDRSRLERVLNHPLLFWPLSYQLRSGKWLIDSLFVKMGGAPTHAYGAYELDKAMSYHNAAMANDPGYREWIGNHRTLLFAASMMLPLTPDSMGVSLTPFLRDVMFDRNKAIFDIGPIFTLRPGGLLSQASLEVWNDLKSIPEVAASAFGAPVERSLQAFSGKPLAYEAPPPPADYTPIGQVTGEPDRGQWR